MPADLLPLNIAFLLALCFSICYTCWYGVSLSAVSAGMVSHFQPCLLVWCLILGHVFSFGSSLSAMPVGVVPHYRSCLLVWCLTIDHAYWRVTSLYAMSAGLFCTSTNILISLVQREEGWLQSDATLKDVPLQTCLLIRCHSQICLLVQYNSIRHTCWVHLIRYTCL